MASFQIPWRLLIPPGSVDTVIGTDGGSSLQQKTGAKVPLSRKLRSKTHEMLDVATTRAVNVQSCNLNMPFRTEHAFFVSLYSILNFDQTSELPRTVSTSEEAPVTLSDLAFICNGPKRYDDV